MSGAALRTALLPLALFVALGLVAVRGLLLAPGLIGLRHDWAIPPYPPQILQAQRELFYSWSQRSLGGRYNLYGLPLTSILEDAPAFLGMDGLILGRVLLAALLTGSGITFLFLARTLAIPRPLAIVASIFYSLTPVLFESIVAGYLHYLTSYALQPLALALYLRATRGGASARRDLLFGGLVTGLTWYQPQYVAMVSLELGLWALLQSGTRQFRAAARALGATVLIAVAMNTTILLSTGVLALASFDTTATPIGQTLGYWSVYASRGNTLANSLILTDTVFSYYLGAITSNPLLPAWVAATFLLYAFIYAGAAMRLMGGPRRRVTLYFLALALLSAWIGKGLGAPLGEVTFYLFVHFLPLRGFREFGHILGLGALATAGLLGLALEWFHAAASLRTRSPLPHPYLHRILGGATRRLPPRAFPVAAALLLVGIHSWPMLSGDFAGNVQTFTVEPDLRGLYDRLAGDAGDYRILWVPMDQPIRYPGVRYAGEDPFLVWSPKPTFDPGFPVNGPLGPWTQFVAGSLLGNRTQYLGDLLSLTSTRYVFLRSTPRTDFQNFSAMGALDRASYDSYANSSRYLLPMLQAQRDLTEAGSFNLTTIRAWENARWLPHAYGADRRFLVVGDLSTLVSLSYLKEVGDLRDFLGERPAFLFLSQLPGGTDVQALLRAVDGVILDPTQLDDLALALVSDGDKVVFDHLEAHGNLALPALERWTSVQQYWFWRDWHYTGSLDDPVLAVDSVPMSFELGTERGTDWDAYIKAFQSPRSASLDFFVGYRRQGNLNLTGVGIGPHWFTLGRLPLDPENHTLHIISRAGAEENRVANPIFEGGWDPAGGTPKAWSQGAGAIALEEGVRAAGDNTVRLVANATIPNGAALVGTPFPVVGATGYYARAWMKYLNAQGTGVRLEGYDVDTGTWVPVARLYANVSRENVGHAEELYFTLPEGVTQLRPILLGGVPRNATRGPAVAWFDDVMVRPDTSDSVVARVAVVHPGALEAARGRVTTLLAGIPFLSISDLSHARVGVGASGGEARPLGPGERVTMEEDLPPGTLRVLARAPSPTANLTASAGAASSALAPIAGGSPWSSALLNASTGPLDLTISQGTDSTTLLDMVVAYDPDRLPPSTGISFTSPVGAGPTTYAFEIRGSGPKFIVFTDAYDAWWRARAGNREVAPMMVNGGMNGFWLDPGDEGQVVVEQTLQGPYTFSVAISLATPVAMVAALWLTRTRVQNWLREGRKLARRILHGGARP